MTAMNDHRLNDNLISNLNSQESNPMNTANCTLLTDSTVSRVNALVTDTGILDTFDRWRTEDGTIRRGGLISERAVLVGLMLLAAEQSPRSLTLLAELLHRRLTSTSRQLLDLPAVSDSESTEEPRTWLSRTQAAFHRMLTLMDPYPRSASATSFREISALVNDRDVVMESRMTARLQKFSEAFILMTVAQQPPRLRDASPSIDLAIDEFFTPSPMVNGFSRLSLDRHVAEEAASGRASVQFRPVDVSAGWHRRSGADASERSGIAPQLRWGWMTNIAVRVDSGAGRKLRVPPLVVAATLTMPGKDVAEAALHLMRSALVTGLTPGTVCADRSYFGNQRIERLHIPTADLGFTPVTDYRTDRLGVHDYKNGAVFIEGSIYCPDMPRALQEASIDYRAGRIPRDTYLRRLQMRSHFELRPKGGPDKNGRYRMTHPTPNAAYNQHHPSPRAGVACTQKSVTFERTDGLSHRQAHSYMSAAWRASYAQASSALEAFNAGFRSRRDERSGSARRVAGFAAAQVFMTIELADYNLRVLDRFVNENPED